MTTSALPMTPPRWNSAGCYICNYCGSRRADWIQVDAPKHHNQDCPYALSVLAAQAGKPPGPDDATVRRMSLRGWSWNPDTPETGAFEMIGCRDSCGRIMLGMLASRLADGGWSLVTYLSGIGAIHGPFGTPDAAADSAGTWFVRVTSGLNLRDLLKDRP